MAQAGQELVWGVLGCANIAQKNIRGIIMSKGNRLGAIATRSEEKGRKFMADNHLGSDVVLYTSYEALLEDPGIEAVYVPLPTTLHKEWVPRVAAAGKHVLCEKPVAENARDLQELIDSCNANNVIFMDGVMFMHHERLELLRKSLSDPLFGQVKRVNSNFCFHASDDFLKSNIRATASADPLGALGDLGWYCIRFALVAFAQGQDISIGQFPRAWSAIAVCHHWNAEGTVPLDCECRVSFGESEGCKWDKLLCFSNSFLLPFRQHAEISATATRDYCGDRVITFDDFVLPRRMNGASFTMESFPPGGAIGAVDHRWMSSIETITGTGEQEVNMFTNFASLVRDDGQHAARNKEYWQQVSLITQRIVDACMTSMLNGGAEVEVVSS